MKSRQAARWYRAADFAHVYNGRCDVVPEFISHVCAELSIGSPALQ
jgi:hypothetical protein